MRTFSNPEEKRQYLTQEPIPAGSSWTMAHSRHRFHADLLVLQHGGHVLCGADQHGGDRGGRRRVPPDEHHQALGFTFGHGSGNYISRALGHGDVEHARKMATTGFVSAFIAGAVFGVLGLLFLDPLVQILGATPTIAPYARDYALYILIGTPFMASSLHAALP